MQRLGRRLSGPGRGGFFSNCVMFGATLGVATVLAGCGGSSRQAENAAGITQRDTRIVHEDCPIDKGSVEKIDANGDKRPEVSIVNDGGREVCRAVDLNLDGKIDAWIYRDPSGQVRRRETDYDRDGRVDEITIYRGGVITEKHRATTLANKLDTWQFYQNGQLARSERDSDGDEVVDQWWEWTKPGCPMIHSDVDSDGRPDPGATVDYCKETGYVPPERQGQRGPGGPSFERPGSLPTEVDSKEMQTPAGEQPPAPATGEKGSK
jgi:hypothetical protein